VSYLKDLNDWEIQLGTIKIDKENPRIKEVIANPKINQSQGQTVILVDDVLYTGKTMAYAIRPLIQSGAQSIQTAVLVDRSYRQFPVGVDYLGYELSTTVNQHVHVDLNEEGKYGVYLY
jgi:pyrimidine operon attenuation protein/uracil phosphoribosyltransferase